MNGLTRLRKEYAVCDTVEFKRLLYFALLSNVVPYKMEGDDTKYAVFAHLQDDLADFFASWSGDEIDNALDALYEEGLIFFDEERHIYVGEIRGMRFFPFDIKNSLADAAIAKLREATKTFETPRSALRRSRGRYIAEQINTFIDRGIDKMTPSDFTTFFTFLYEMFTGGESYLFRNKVEYYQTSNMLKAYDKFTTFAILVEGVLNFSAYRRKGVPTLTTVAVIKDDIFGALTKGSGSKDYMRDAETESDGF